MPTTVRTPGVLTPGDGDADHSEDAPCADPGTEDAEHTSPHRQPSSGATPLSSFLPQPLPFPPVALPPPSSSWSPAPPPAFLRSPASPPTPVLLPPGALLLFPYSGAPPPANPYPPSSRSPAPSDILSFLLPKPRPPPITGRLSPGVRPSCLSLSFFLPKSRPTANPCLPSSRSPAPGQSLSSFLWSPAPRLFLFFLLAPSQSLSCFLPEARPPANPGAPSSGAPPHCPSVGPKPARPALRLARTWRPVVQSVPPAGPGRWALPVVEKHCGSGARPFLSLRPGWRAGCGRTETPAPRVPGPQPHCRARPRGPRAAGGPGVGGDGGSGAHGQERRGAWGAAGSPRRGEAGRADAAAPASAPHGACE
ncbi:uncharacterized protein LOC144291590 [Canis aureus]